MRLLNMSAWELLKKLARRLSDNAATDRAAQLAYYFLFSLFPFLFFLVTLTAYLPVKGALDDLFQRLDPILPDQAMDIIQKQLDALVSRGLALSLWGASRAIDALRSSLNLSYDVKESRPWWKTQLLALGITILTSALMLVSVVALALGRSAGLWLAIKLQVNQIWLMVWALLRWPITALGVMTVLALLYYFLPDVKQEFRFITPGSVTGTLLWLLSSWGFTKYAEHFGSYDKTYGSIGGVIVLLVWLYITGLIFVVGGEINALLEHESAEGKARGARAAGEQAPPPVERPSISAPGATKSAENAARSRRRLWRPWRKSPA
jgi:membrane protein